MRIAVVSTMDSVVWGGSEELWAAMVREAIAEGHEALVSLPAFRAGATQLTELRRAGVTVVARPDPAWNSLVYRARRWLRGPAREITDFRPDVVCISQGTTYDGLGDFVELSPLLTGRGVPYVVVCQANPERRQPPPREALGFLTGAARLLFVSAQNWQLAERQLAAALPNAAVIRNPFNVAEVSTVPWPSMPTALASVARMDSYQKGQDLLFDALRHPDWRDREWQLNLYGGGRDLSYLQALARHYGLESRTHFHGHVTDIRKVWADNHLLLLPSRHEGTPLALIEAMLCGRAAVVTDVGDNADWVQEGETGFVAQAPTVGLILETLDRAWRARDRWQEMGRRAHDAALAKFDPNPGRTLLGHLEEAVGNGARARP